MEAGRKTIAPTSKSQFVREGVPYKDPIPSKRPRIEHYEEARRPVPRPVHKAFGKEPLPQRKAVRRNPDPEAEPAKLAGTAVKKAPGEKVAKKVTDNTDKSSKKAENTTPAKPDVEYELSSLMSSILNDEVQQIMIKKLPAHIKATFEERYGKDTEVATVSQLVDLLDEKIRTKDSVKSSSSAKKETLSNPIVGVKKAPHSSQVKVKKLEPTSSQVIVAKQSVVPSMETKSPTTEVSVIGCTYCKNLDHTLYQCDQFAQMTNEHRRLWAKMSGVCLKCLLAHSGQECTYINCCAQCSSAMHNSLICDVDTIVATVKQSTELAVVDFSTDVATVTCIFCLNPTHLLYQCPQFLQMTIIHRRNWAKACRLCFKCFQTHYARNCTRTDCCSHCNSPMHNWLLCFAENKVATMQQVTENWSNGICCLFCKNPTHLLYQCAQFLQMTIFDRVQWAKTTGLCFKCFEEHLARDCSRTDCCSHCNSPAHNWLLCDAEIQVATAQQQLGNWSSGVSCLFCGNPTHLLYQCARFLEMPVVKRIHWAKESRLCFKCFQEHFARDCSSTGCCSHCDSPMHNWLLCDTESVSCLYCSNPTHLLFQCGQFLHMTVVDRRQWAKESGFCFKCFQEHFARDCSRTDYCSHCGSPMHSWLLCDAENKVETVCCLFCTNPTHLLYQCAQFLQMTVGDRRQWAKNCGYCFKCFEEHFAWDCTCTNCCTKCNSPMHSWLLCDMESVNCLFCMNPTHLLYQCAQFLQMTVADRRQWATDSGYCFKCFQEHFARDCSRTDCCSHCDSPMHNWLLCYAEGRLATSQQEGSSNGASCLFCVDPTHLLYQCAQEGDWRNQMTAKDRRYWARNSGLCFKCFQEHFARDCSRTDSCSHCNCPTHNWLLCDAEDEMLSETKSSGGVGIKSCWYCSKAAHKITKCPQFLKASVKDRSLWLKTSHRCYKCFNEHVARECKREVWCTQCNAKHNPLLCEKDTKSAILIQCAKSVPKEGTLQQGIESVLEKETLDEVTESVPEKATLQQGTESVTNKASLQQSTKSVLKKATLQQDTEAVLNAAQSFEPGSSAIIETQCLYCIKKGHTIYDCAQFLKKTVGEKSQWVKKYRRCYNCFKEHLIRECNFNVWCDQCQSKHNPLLCEKDTLRQHVEIGCFYCSDPNHTLSDCTQFIYLKVKKKRVWAKNSGRCVKCFQGHPMYHCPNDTNCDKCGSRKHNSLLCFTRKVSVKCLYCSETTHTIYKCVKFLEMAVYDRVVWSMTMRRCYKCFEEHIAPKCTLKVLCAQCDSPRHNTLLCEANTPLESETSSPLSCLYCNISTHTILKCAEFLNLTTKHRRMRLKILQLCRKCLQKHQGPCNDIDSHCTLCDSRKHNTLVCFNNSSSQATANVEPSGCPYCKNPTHAIHNCPQFIEMTTKQRLGWIRKANFCRKCLEEHDLKICTLLKSCAQCNSPSHHVLLCYIKCIFCTENSHVIYKCGKFLKMAVKDRRLWAKKSKLCLKCLKEHIGVCVPNKYVCDICSSPMHNTILCYENTENEGGQQSADVFEEIGNLEIAHVTTNQVDNSKKMAVTSSETNTSAGLSQAEVTITEQKLLDEKKQLNTLVESPSSQITEAAPIADLLSEPGLSTSEMATLEHNIPDKSIMDTSTVVSPLSEITEAKAGLSSAEVATLEHKISDATIQFINTSTIESPSTLITKATPIADLSSQAGSSNSEVATLEHKISDATIQFINTSTIESPSILITKATPIADLSSEPEFSSIEVTTLKHKISDKSLKFLKTSTVESPSVTEVEPIATLIKETEMSIVEQTVPDETTQVMDTLATRVIETTPVTDGSPQPTSSEAKVVQSETMQIIDTSVEPLSIQAIDTTGITDTDMAELIEVIDEAIQFMDTSGSPSS